MADHGETKVMRQDVPALQLYIVDMATARRNVTVAALSMRHGEEMCINRI